VQKKRRTELAIHNGRNTIIELFSNPTPASQVLPLKMGEDCANLDASLSPFQGDERSGGVGNNLQIDKFTNLRILQIHK